MAAESGSGSVTRAKVVPATTTEAEAAFQIMRAALTTLVVGRKSKAITITERQRRKAFGAYLRMQLEWDGSIRLFIEDPPPKARSGVVYSTVPRD